MATQVNKKRKFVADGVFKAELNELLMRELAEDGYAPLCLRRANALPSFYYVVADPPRLFPSSATRASRFG